MSGLTLIPETVFGTASGNYDGSSTSFSGDRQKGVNYYRRSRFIQSVQFICDEFVGIMTVQATLDDDPTADSRWFDVYVFPTDDSSTLDGSTAITANFTTAIQGKFTWLRVTVSNFTGGTINSVTLTYGT